ncbi:hypothetical protein DGo_PC0190 (plasmid) [Deinococcus gobiensis I-0]|uniref:Uncharacterized protein n=1 Tax=Deinococcus gobiensis (strain DSM 21396 / JCM 16679 / CGMCC 1.7299 / I-0) TaxID=745776 RepID=H8H385_DEIGI|nr:hypothetical protein DGo_PC0190 [Deinococcus gobiensis I-0]
MGYLQYTCTGLQVTGRMGMGGCARLPPGADSHGDPTLHHLKA